MDPLFTASKNGDLSKVQSLLNDGISPNSTNQRGTTVLTMAILYDHVPIVHLLLKHGANPDRPPVLHYAVIKGNLNIVEILLWYNADSNCKNSRGDTPLHVASRHNYLAIVEKLLQYQADPYIEDQRGWTADDLTSEAEIRWLIERYWGNREARYC